MTTLEYLNWMVESEGWSVNIRKDWSDKDPHIWFVKFEKEIDGQILRGSASDLNFDRAIIYAGSMCYPASPP